MNKNEIFDNAYPFILPEEKTSDLSLEDIKIPPYNIVARLNDQWVQEIGLDLKKFGYTQTLCDLLNKKCGDKLHRDNLIEKVRILQTIGSVFQMLSSEDKKKAIDFIEREPMLYPNLRGSRDKTHFHHKKQMTVVLLDLISHIKDTIHEKPILDMLFDILKDNYSIVKKKTYFDEYNSYSYSEDQRKIAGTIVSGIEKKLLSVIDKISNDKKVSTLRELWTYPTLHKNNELKHKIVKKVHLEGRDLDMVSLKELVSDLEREQAPESAVLREVIVEGDIGSENVGTEEILDFYNNELSNTDSPEHIKLMSKNIKKIFEETEKIEDKEKVIEMLLFPKRDLDSLIGLEHMKQKSNVLPFVELITDSDEAATIFLKHFNKTKLQKSFFEEIALKLSSRESILKTFKNFTASFLKGLLKKDDLEEHTKEFTENLIQFMRHELIEESLGEEIIDHLISIRANNKTADYILKRVFLGAHSSYLGRYLQYMLLTRS